MINIPSKDVSQIFFFPALFPFYSCEFQFGVSYRKTHNNAVRFSFVIRQSLGAMGERLYLHCNVTICRRKDAPQPTIFNCFTHGEYCPNKTAELITKGPFVVWPFITKEERDKLKKKSSKRWYYTQCFHMVIWVETSALYITFYHSIRS